MPNLSIRAVVAILLTSVTLPADADAVDDFVRAHMAKRKIVGLSLAVIQDGKIVKAQAYGNTELSGGKPVTPNTLFQAGSISKSVSALGALRLVEQGSLSLDEDVNVRLKSWRVPDSPLLKEKKVTLRGILSHTAGLTVHGFPGYRVTADRPTLVQILNGERPANTSPIRVDILPGSKWRYSGGGYTVMQQLITDVTGQPFDSLMQETVLGPLGMTSSTFQQPLPDGKARLTASGYYPGERPVPGRWNVYPEMAAAGLWTTPTDLANFAIAVQQSLAGTENRVISQKMTREMLTNVLGDDGLGVFLQGKGKTRRFEHGGRDEGFDAQMTAYTETGQGAVVMINANDNSGTLQRVIEAIAKQYQWPEYPIRPEYSAIPDKEPDVAVRLKTMLAEMAEGRSNGSDFTTEFGRTVDAQVKQGLPGFLKSLGKIQGLTLVERRDRGTSHFYRYRVDFETRTMLMPLTIDASNKISGLALEPD
jgi:CubicO group peptidase (beta-lactamase class C family)